MEIKIEKDSVNKVMNRREIEAYVDHGGKTPSREEVKKEITHMLALSPEHTAVISIHQIFGAKASRVLVHSYLSKEAFANVQKYILERPKKKEKKEAGKEAGEKEAKVGKGKEEKGKEEERPKPEPGQEQETKTEKKEEVKK